MKTFTITCFLAICVFHTSCKTPTEKQQNTPSSENPIPPNVIIILIDDAGYADFGFMGSEDLETPRIDELAASGVVFTDAHVSATVCAPSRAGLMTGKYQQRFGFEANNTGGIGLSNEVVTMADVFQANGYNTYALGKWHLGEEESDHPNQRGFDEFYGFLSGSRSYFPLKDPGEKNMLQYNGERMVFEGYLTDVLGDQSLRFVEESKETPFFMYLAYNAVHTPMEAKPEDLEKYRNHPRQDLAAMTWSLDQNVGKLLDKLEALGLRQNTLIYFLSDNGGAHNNQSQNGMLKGWKGNHFEGGHRVPFILSYPSKVEPGKTFDGLSSSLDIFKTSAAAATLKLPKDLQLDGVNLLPYLTGELQGDPHQQLFWRKLEESAARMGAFKTVRLHNVETVLYNLDENIQETENLAGSNLAMLKELEEAYRKWEETLIAPLWDEGDEWMDVTYEIQKSLMQNKQPLYEDIHSDAFKKNRIRINRD
ncbi:sulfatase-like hydrolase/transferase [Leeuwenhoekiella parthenopeia]|uniref:Sulfatase-like hydrolase/transferase n=1 Tax=Leeuwenhoekiella parthenopeia TaxID=2890320 RepID=A0ABS8GPK8_9FLAO|nr:sulfatase-like hydrolase/transferase [Leeuwenhoekiella parthenopeia]MCC4211222.1 sulfatase-like hydrolase/transferase [Leeuwenhoekiella parthenopeia]